MLFDCLLCHFWVLFLCLKLGLFYVVPEARHINHWLRLSVPTMTLSYAFACFHFDVALLLFQIYFIISFLNFIWLSKQINILSCWYPLVLLPCCCILDVTTGCTMVRFPGIILHIFGFPFILNPHNHGSQRKALFCSMLFT